MAGFKVFESRRAPEYRKALQAMMSWEAREDTDYDGLDVTAQPILDRSRTKARFQGIDRIVNIDLIGMAGTVLLGGDDIHERAESSRELQGLVARMEELNREHKTAVRVRFLLQYPYSIAGQNRILAEDWKYRPFIGDFEQDIHRRDERRHVPGLSLEYVQRSQLVGDLSQAISTFRELERQAQSFIGPNSPNRLEMRLSTISNLICGLRINGYFMFDPYHYGREVNAGICAVYDTPILLLDARTQSNRKSYAAFCNHFQYIWQCDSTLPVADIVTEDNDPQLSSVGIRHPRQVTGQHKIARLKSMGVPSSEAEEHGAEDAEAYWTSYARGLGKIIERYCPAMGSIHGPEVGFLISAWAERPNGKTAIHHAATTLLRRFEHDFNRLFVRGVRVRFLATRPGESLPARLFEMLDNSTFSVAILTAETEDGHCRPNVYFELGYLMNRNGAERTFIMADKDVNIPSDFRHLAIRSFDSSRDPEAFRTEILDVYQEVLDWMVRKQIISQGTRNEVGNTLREADGGSQVES